MSCVVSSHVRCVELSYVVCVVLCRVMSGVLSDEACVESCHTCPINQPRHTRDNTLYNIVKLL